MGWLGQVQQGKPGNNPQAASIVGSPTDAVGSYKHQLEDGCWYSRKTFWIRRGCDWPHAVAEA